MRMIMIESDLLTSLLIVAVSIVALVYIRRTLARLRDAALQARFTTGGLLGIKIYLWVAMLSAIASFVVFGSDLFDRIW